MNIKWIIPFLLLPVLMAMDVLAADISAQEITPFYSSNRNPFVQIYGLPQAEGGSLNGKGELGTRFTFEVANSFSKNSKNGEGIFIDGETYRLNLSLRYGFSDTVEVGFDIPVISHSEGFLDGFIENWHGFFGLPNADREDYPQDNLNYSYRRGNQELVNIEDSTMGLGDLMLSVGYQLYGGQGLNSRSLALRSGIKLPTGDSDDLHGSGGTDISLRIEGTDSKSLQFIRTTLFGSAGVLYMSDSDILDDIRSDFAGFGTAGVGFRLSKRIDLKTQVDFHSPFYQDSPLTELGDWSAQLLFGGTIRFSERYMLDLGISEDIIVDTSPDIVFHMGFSGRF